MVDLLEVAPVLLLVLLIAFIPWLSDEPPGGRRL
jgi:hypothetical protein